MGTLTRFALLLFLTSCSSPPATQNPAPRSDTDPIVFTDEFGKRHDLSEALARGASVTLVFWQTWCATCRAEGPDLARAADKYAGKIEFVGIVTGPDSIVDTTEMQNISAQLALPYPQIRDRDGSIAERFHVESTPTIIVLGRGGTVLYRGSGLPKDWSALAGS